MYLRVLTRHLSVHRVLAIIILVGMFLSFVTPFAPTVNSQNVQSRVLPNERKGTPRPGKPEGLMKSMDQLKNEGPKTEEIPDPLPSSIRSPKMPLKAWDGRRVGDPPGKLIPEKQNESEPEKSARATRPRAERAVRRSHAKSSAPFVVLDDTFIDNFYTIVMTGYTPLSAEKPYWRGQMRAGYAKNQTALNLSAIELGKTLLESAYYLGRGRSDSDYVSDLYWAYLMRAPDPSGWSFWTGVVGSSGRENVRRAFEESGDFLTLMTTIAPNSSSASGPLSLISAQTDPINQPNGGLLTRDGAWSLPIISLPGRSGLDLGLSLSYSSQVWTRSGPFIYFDEDIGTPSPGFRLGFPTIQRQVYNSQTNTLSYLLITSSGARVELRQVGTSNVYEAADSSYLELTDTGTTLVLRSTDGTQLTYQHANNSWRCIQVKDRNGNYLTVAVNSLGQITTITDTLGRVLTFNYDSNANLLSITQTWGISTTHTWASFSWSTKQMQQTFTSGDVRVIGPTNGTYLPVLSRVSANDGSFFDFDYNDSLQVTTIKKYHWSGSPSTLRATSTFTYETPDEDAPRLTDSRISALNWTGINGVPSQVTSTYSVSGSTYQMTAPDGTIYKEIYGTGYQRGLVNTSEVWSGGVKQKWTTTTWTQDNTGLAYELNPRVTETNIYDASSNRRRTTISYHSSFGLPHIITEYGVGGTSPIRYKYIDYNNNSAYLNRRIIGLVEWVQDFDASWNLMSKTQYNYDWDFSGDMFLDTPAAATQHDRTNYGPSFIIGRGNLSQMARYDVNDPTNAGNTAIERKWRVNSTGSLLLERDHLWHQKQIAYGDDYSDSVNRNTFAYPTVLTDEDGNQSTVKYNYDFGATTRTQSPTPAGQSQGIIQTMLYNSDASLERITTANNSAYRRFLYGPDYVASYTTVNTVADEAYSIQYADGAGRSYLTGSNHPGSTGGYKAIQTIYDQMGRAIKVSNPTEINGSWVPSGDDSAGWLYTQQTYNWQGKPLITTNPDSTTKDISYSGCGCAGGAVVTMTDEGTIDGGVAKRRQQKFYSDVLGRKVKTEALNWQGGTVYAATVNTYNARDQITQVRQYAGPEGSATYQDTTLAYDGHARLSTRHLPEQQDDPGIATDSDHTTWTYNQDDTIATVKDARGAVTTFGYSGTNRRLIKSLTHTYTGSPTLTSSYDYDAVGNRTSMTDDLGSATYTRNELSQITSETRVITGVGSFSLNYTYNLAGSLTGITDPFGAQIGYNYNNAAQVTSISGSSYAGVTSYASGMQYRAWGALKAATYASANVTVGYNANLKPSTFEIPSLLKKGYQYFDDGSFKFIQDQLTTNSRFDRSFEYDHMKRIKVALSGQEARGGAPTNNRPYNETMAYDEFGHLTARNVKIWNQNDSMADTYVNNRRVGNNYDSDGRIINGLETWNSAGSRATFGDLDPYLTEQGYDGDGRRLKTVLKSQDPSTLVWTTHKITYYISSTVLGGALISEVSQTGTKEKTFVYQGSSILAVQDAAYPVVGWELYDASGYSYRGANGAAELDPFGMDAGLLAPFAWPPPSPNFGEIKPYYGVPEMTSASACVLDRVPVSCEVLNALIRAGGVETETVQRRERRPESPGQKPEVILEVVKGRVIPYALGMSFYETFSTQGVKEGYRSDWVTNYAEQEKGLTQDNPNVLQGENNGEDCGIEVNFKLGTSYPGNPALTNGVTTVPDPKTGLPSLGLGFSVSGWVKSDGIGVVGSGTQQWVNNPNGKWKIDQLTAAWTGDNGRLLEEKSTFSDIPKGVAFNGEGNSFGWYDHPGATIWGDGLARFENHIVKVYSGKTVCEVKFHFIQHGRTIKWGRGLL